MPFQSRTLTQDEADSFGRELDALHRSIVADLGQRDADHILSVMRMARRSETVGRLLLHFGLGPLSFVAGTGALTLSKILENMELGHNIMHGQYDWTGDPDLNSLTYEWDNVCPGADWRHSHNHEHHTFTNILGKDRDVGYGWLRVCAEQRWRPVHLAQPFVMPLLALFFQWGIGTHDLRLDEAFRGEQSLDGLLTRARPFLAKAGRKVTKEYLLLPALALVNAPRVLVGNLLANSARNLWTFSVVFCGHFPAGVRVYQQDEARNESRGQWYLRQLNSSANIEGSWRLHLLTGHLSHQIEHHLFPDLPAARYPEIEPNVREICARYGQVYRSGRFQRQLRSVAVRILRFSLPGPR